MSKPCVQQPLYPRHYSVGPGVRLRPRNMERLPFDVPRETSEMLERNALSIFTDCTNANMTFRDCLTAILVTGMHWGVEAYKEIESRPAPPSRTAGTDEGE